MGDFRSKLSNARAKLIRRSSGVSTSSSVKSRRSSSHEKPTGAPPTPQISSSLTKLPEVSTTAAAAQDEPEHNDQKEPPLSPHHPPKNAEHRPGAQSNADHRPESVSSGEPRTLDSSFASLPSAAIAKQNPRVTLEEPTPDPLSPANPAKQALDRHDTLNEDQPSPLPSRSTSSLARPTAGLIRRQSLVTGSNARILKSLLDTDKDTSTPGGQQGDYFATGAVTFNPGMLHRKIWVKRPGASATLVQIREDDLVDDVRDMILKKYANSLGRSYDAPDVTLRIVPRDHTQKAAERTLGPEEEMCRTLDAYYPGGQTVDEALVIDVPSKRTPRPSPRAMSHAHSIPYYYEDSRPVENGAEYFPPMPLPVVAASSPAALTSASHDSRQSHAAHERSMSVLNTGHVPPLPSPGATRRTHQHRPKYGRQHTSSPTALTGPPGNIIPASTRPSNRPRHDSSASDSKHPAPAAPPLPTPPAPQAEVPAQKVSTPPAPRVSSPRPSKSRKRQKPSLDGPTLPSGLLDGSVPPINVLIVEDNMINLRVLGAFMERLKVRWQRAINGREAVTKWRAGGFHLVLMDIQLPIMNGLEATKEIRRLERVNSIGVFSNATDMKDGEELKDEDKLGDRFLFKSPVIIVALTASSLQSDRHEALAAGCNDFLTKPVNFVWLERKVKEWGCMQALIDFDGWRKWKDFAAQSDSFKASKEKAKEKEKKDKEKGKAALKDATAKEKKENGKESKKDGAHADTDEGEGGSSSAATPST